MSTLPSTTFDSGTWQVQEAKNRFSEVIDRALQDGPQLVTRHGKPVVRVVAVQDGAPLGGSNVAAKDDGFATLLLGMPKSGHPEGLPLPRRRNRRAPPSLG